MNNKNTAPKFLIAAGGTGGHLFPALAVVEELIKQTNGTAEFVFIGSKDRIESKIVPALGYEYHTVSVKGIGSIVSIDTVMMPVRLLSSMRKSSKIISRKEIDAVIATGAYLSFPPGYAAHHKGIPLFLMESNVNPGKTIKMLSSSADLIFTSFEESKDYYNASDINKLRVTGNPVRGMISETRTKEEAREELMLDPEKDTVFIFGGSLGALSINKSIERNFDILRDIGYQFIWQTGNNYKPPSDVPPNIKVMQFIDNMGIAYTASDLVVSRSGATTIAELCVRGMPSILVPLPSASNKEQAKNAKVLEKKGAAMIVNNEETDSKLPALINELISDKAKLEKMSQNAASLAKPNAAKDCARMILEHIAYNNH